MELTYSKLAISKNGRAGLEGAVLILKLYLTMGL